MNENIIILHNPQANTYEAWGTLTELCREREYSYNYLKRKKFPFTYKGLVFRKSIAPTVGTNYIVIIEADPLICFASSINPIKYFGMPFDVCGLKMYSVPFRALNGC